VACKATTPTTTGLYSEDLSVHRPINTSGTNEVGENGDIPVKEEPYKPPSGHIKVELDSIAKVAYLENKKGRYVDGFVIQVYSGSSREEANQIRDTMFELFPELSPKVSYHQPTFRVKAGRFTDRLEAKRIHEEVKKEFPTALLLPDRFFMKYE